MPGSSVHSWLGCFHSSFNTSAAAWETGTAVFETWLTNGGTPAIKTGQTLAFANTGSNTTWNGQAQLLTSRWITVLNGSHPGLILRIGIPMVASQNDWDNLLAGTWDAQFSNFNQYIVNHDGDAAGGVARLIRLRIGWEMNLVDNAWGPRFSSDPLYPGSTYSKAKFREGWRRIAGLFATSRALGTKLVWNPATPHKTTSWTPHTTSSLWPGDDNAGVAIPGFNSVDVIGCDAYDQWLTGPTTSQQTRWAAAYNGTGVGGEGIASILALAAAENLPVSFDEWGIDLNTSVLAAPNQNKHSGDDDYYVLQMSQTMQTLIDVGRFDGHCYWDNNNNITSQLSPTTIGPLAAAQFLAVWGNMNSWVIYNRAKKKMFNGTIALGVDVFKILLVQTTSNFQTLTLSTVASLTDQIASAGGYTQVGLPMVVTWTVGASAGAYLFSMAPVIQTATGAGMVNIRAAVIKNSAGQLLCYANITTSQFAVPASTVITLAPTAGGIFTLGSPISPVVITPSVGTLAISATQPAVTNSSSLNILRSVRTITNYGPTTLTGFYKEFGAYFRQDDVPQNSFVEVRQGDGVTVIPSQGDNFVYWPNNSLRSCSMTMRYPLSLTTTPAAGSSGTLRLFARSGAFNTTSWTTSAAITARDIRAEITLPTIVTQQIGTADGVTLTYSGTLAGAPLRPGTVSVTETSGGAGSKISVDNGAGGWTAASQVASGSINYTTGAISITFTSLYVPTTGPVTASYAVTSNPGTVYTLSANNEVARATNIRQVRSGPVSASWRIFGEFRNGTASGSTPEGALWGIMYLTFFSDSTYKVWVTYYPTRASQTTAAAKSCLGYAVRDYFNANPLFVSTTGFTFYAGCPVVACNSDGLQPYSGTGVDKAVVAYPPLTFNDSTTTGLYDAAATWWYKSTPTMISALTLTTASSWTVNSSVDFAGVNATGGHNWVGPLTYEAVASWLSGAWSGLRSDRINALAGLANAYSWPDATTGYQWNLNNVAAANYHVYPGLGSPGSTKGWGFGTTGVITILGGGPSDPGATPYDGTHAPNYCYWQYLATGEEQWLDLLHDQAIGQLGAANPSTQIFGRNPVINLIPKFCTFWGTAPSRGTGWNIRNVDNAQWVTPDAHPLKQYLLDAELNTFDMLAEWTRPPNSPATMATLGIYYAGDVTGGINSGWMHDFLASSCFMAIRRGRITTSQRFITFHIIPWVIGRFVGGCPWACTSYRIGIGAGQTPADGTAPGYAGMTFPQVWSDVWYGGGNPLDAPVTTAAGASCPTSGLNPISSVWGFGSGNTYGAIAYAIGAMALTPTVAIGTASTQYDYLHTEMLANSIPEGQGSGAVPPGWAAYLNAHWRIDKPGA